MLRSRLKSILRWASLPVAFYSQRTNSTHSTLFNDKLTLTRLDRQSLSEKGMQRLHWCRELQQDSFSSFIVLCGQHCLRGKEKSLLRKSWMFNKKKDSVPLTLAWHFWVCTLCFSFSLRDGERKWRKEKIQRGWKNRGTHSYVPLCKLFAAYTAKSMLHLFHLP